VKARGLRVDILGPLKVTRDGVAVTLPNGRTAVLCTILALTPGEAVSVDVLTARIWDEQLPQRVRGSLQNLVMRLRRSLGPGAVATVTGGYLLDVDPGNVDLVRFRRLIAEAADADEPGQARTLLGEALRLWRGEPLADLHSEALERELLPSLIEERLAAQQRRIDLDLGAGDYDRAIVELRELTSQYPLRESLWYQLIAAVAGAGRPAEAIQVYHQIRQRLNEELGVGPSPDLQEIYHQLLRIDSDVADAAERSPGASRVSGQGADHRAARNELPGGIPDFAGRRAELQQLLDVLPRGAAVAISAIDGMAGIGKTALAVHAAHRLADHYPDGQLFLDLHGYTPGREPVGAAEALEVLLRSMGVPAELIPDAQDERAALWRAQLSGRRVLIVLDNAATSAQVRPLLPGGRDCLALITSRRRLTDLDTTHELSLDVLPSSDAAALFAGIVRDTRAAAEPDAVTEVVNLCGQLPLAIRIAGGRLRSRPSWTVAYLARRLREGQSQLEELATGNRSVIAAFTVSYEQLTPDQQRLFRLLGLIPGASFDAYLAAAVGDIGLGHAGRLLEDLVDVHLLEQRVPGRYRFHDLVRAYSTRTATRVDSDAAQRAAVGRMLDYYLYVADRTGGHIDPPHRPTTHQLADPPGQAPPIRDQAEALAWCQTEYENLLNAITYAADHGWHEHAWLLPHALWRFFYRHHHIQDWIATHQLALVAANRLEDTHAQAETLKTLGIACWRVGRHTDADDYLRQAVDHFSKAGDRRGEADALNYLGYVRERLGRYEEAIDDSRQALAYFRSAGDQPGQAGSLNNLGVVYRRLGRYKQAVDYYQQAIAHSRKIGDRWSEAGSLNNLGVVLEQLGRYGEAIRHYDEVLAYFSEVGNRWSEARVLNNLGNSHCNLGAYERAIEYHQRALRLMQDIGDRDGEADVLNDLADTCRAGGRPEQARAHYRGALDLAVQTRNRYLQARAHDGLAHTLDRSHPAAARQHRYQALNIYTDLGVPEAAAIRERLGEISEQTGG
jgi:DNA-binding SARP family transcriptional activator/Flp pilus assembly protein TadD